MRRTFRSVIPLVVALSLLLAVPIPAGARAPEAPRQPTLRIESWLSAALGWLQGALDAPGQWASLRSPSPKGVQQKADGDDFGGSCIDPQGNRYPPPCIWN
ncbi:MAG: hypothetical protein WAM82_01315 [Thermoanaerobaculia bacterium]